jgi:hypothetical protein
MQYLGSTWEILETNWNALRTAYAILRLLDCLGLELVGGNRPCLPRFQLIFWDCCNIFQIYLGSTWEILETHWNALRTALKLIGMHSELDIRDIRAG